MRHFALALALSAATALPAAADPARYDIDPTHMTAAFMVDHLGYAMTLGQFTEVSGSFMYDTETQELSDVQVTIQAASVFTANEARDNHVRSGDFLDAEANPEIVFTAAGGTPETDTTGAVAGELTLRGITQPVTLDVTLNQVADYPFGHGKETLGISARATIDRTDWEMTYFAGPVGTEVDIILEFEAIRAD